MWYEIFKFELKYRAKRPETYVFFLVLFLFSMVGVDFIFQGVEISMMKKNAPLVIAKTMGAITGIFMIMTSMIMGVPILRDFQYNIESLLYINPISKNEYLLGRFLGSFLVVLFIFSGLLFGMMLGSQMSWHKEEEMLAFNSFHYIQSFFVIVVPIVFFGSCLFFVTGMLSKKLLVVYTQGVVLFVVFLLTKAIKNDYWQAIFDPFSLTTLTQISKEWSINQRNTFGISLTDVILHNKLFWSLLGVFILIIGYRKFSFSVLPKPNKKRKTKAVKAAKTIAHGKVHIPKTKIHYNFKTHFNQLIELSKFYTKSFLKETSFWAIAICGILIIIINSVNLGTIHGVDSYPTTYFIVEELQEMSLYFFMIILVFYSGELVWKERTTKLHLIYDATAIPDIVALSSKFIALIVIYMVLMFSLILTGIVFQVTSGYFEFELSVYFSGFFLEILPFLILYTFIAFFFQVLSNNKFVGILLVLLFLIVNTGLRVLGFDHSLLNFGGKALGTYSEMNGYGHFLKPYLWVKSYWLLFGFILLIVSALFSVRGTETQLSKRFKSIKDRISKPVARCIIAAVILFMSLGAYIFYNTNILNDYWTNSEEIAFRANYEKTLKTFEYIEQPKITAVNLKVELYPEQRAYTAEGYYMLKNSTTSPIADIHIQKVIASHVTLDALNFEGGAIKNEDYQHFDYNIYTLSQILKPGNSIKMHFKQSFTPKGFDDENSATHMVYNGTFFNHQEFPTIGYNRKYELRDVYEREEFDLNPRPDKARRSDAFELKNGHSGGDSDGIMFEMVIGTTKSQTAIAPGNLVKQWAANNRNYFHYKMTQPMINFYAIVSAEYEVKRDIWKSTNDTTSKTVALEIYHHDKHTYNLERMMASMKASLDYFSTNFGPYQYDQLRIMEFPRYAEFAQSFPNTIPFSESIGFVLDIDDQTDVDMAFYVTAHEVAHQWFGMQVEAANVQGRHFILETLSQYAAMMVLKHQYSEEKVVQFLEYQEEIYERERKKSKTPEPALALVENEDYIYYNKGAMAMYALQQKIGETNVDLAIKRFINDWNTINGRLKRKTNRYATSKDLLKYIREVTPDNLQEDITQLFENVSR